jgi:hypothetical protein
MNRISHLASAVAKAPNFAKVTMGKLARQAGAASLLEFANTNFFCVGK